MEEAIFLGYDLQVGGKWAGTYKVCPLTAFDGMSFKARATGHRAAITHRLTRTQTLVQRTPVFFPMLGKYFTDNNSVPDQYRLSIVPDPDEFEEEPETTTKTLARWKLKISGSSSRKKSRGPPAKRTRHHPPKG